MRLFPRGFQRLPELKKAGATVTRFVNTKTSDAKKLFDNALNKNNRELTIEQKALDELEDNGVTEVVNRIGKPK